MLDAELTAMALLTIKNAFYADFSALVNSYVKAAESLTPPEVLEAELGELTSIYGRDTEAAATLKPQIWSNLPHCTRGYETLLEALQDEEALDIHLQGSKVFMRLNKEWWFTTEISK